MMRLSKKSFSIYGICFASGFITVATLLIQPAEAMSGDYLLNLLIHFLFFIIFVLVSSVLILIAPSNSNSFARTNFFADKSFYYISIVVSICGFLLIAYDRIFLRGIDYREGVRSARYQWLASDGGNFAGVLGNLSLSFTYFSVAYLIFCHNSLTKFHKLFGLIAVMICSFGIGLLNGGRSNVFVLLIYAAAVYLVSNNKLKVSSLISINILMPLMAAIMLISYVTSSSADLGAYTPIEHYLDDVHALYGRILYPIPSFGFLNDLIYSVNYFAVYIFHGFWTAQVSTELLNMQPFYTLYPIISMLYPVFGMALPDSTGYFSDTGAFISLPGALYYDYSILGVVIGGILFGLLMSVVLYFVEVQRFSYLTFCISVMVIMVGLCSPFMLAYGFSTFFFIPIPFVFFKALSSLKRFTRKIHE